MGAGRAVWVKIRFQRCGAGRVAHQGARGRVIAVGSGTAIGGPGAGLDGRAHRA